MPHCFNLHLSFPLRVLPFVLPDGLSLRASAPKNILDLMLTVFFKNMKFLMCKLGRSEQFTSLSMGRADLVSGEEKPSLLFLPS